ncbi:OB-fold protein [Vineibacter terrae]|uniref:OB-fold protein n=1 Tax=Vineibacter terrae TaxID=2586908 RepID=UPI002E32D0DA|nr:hypothetical protein [Vineibacter terrae]HEX2889898.1 hypothetical protein [Vineibacter terrae]
MTRCGTIAITLALLPVLAGGATAQTTAPVSAKALAKAYADNGRAAMAKYGGKPILLRGTIGRINPNQFGTSTMILDGDTMPTGLGIWLRVGQDAQTVQVGQTVTLRCEMGKDNDMAQDCIFAR